MSRMPSPAISRVSTARRNSAEFEGQARGRKSSLWRRGDEDQGVSRRRKSSRVVSMKRISSMISIFTGAGDSYDDDSSDSEEGAPEIERSPSQGAPSQGAVLRKTPRRTRSFTDFVRPTPRRDEHKDESVDGGPGPCYLQDSASSTRRRRHSLDRHSLAQWAEWQRHGLWAFYRRHEGSTGANQTNAMQHVIPLVEMKACLGDMTMDDLLQQEDDEAGEEVDETELGEPQILMWSDENTILHDICRHEGYQQLVRRLKTEPYVEPFHTIGRKGTSVLSQRRVFPLNEVSRPNHTGQLPIHVAAQTVRLIEERDGSMRRMEDFNQAAPDLVTVLCTGRDPRTGEKIFNVDRDDKGGVMSCIYQDSVGMTALHSACLCGSSSSYEVVCRLVEANPRAAAMCDADGFLPLDIVCKSPNRGASDILKILLRANPSSACVSSDAGMEMEKDWHDCYEKTDPVSPFRSKDPQCSRSYVDAVLHCFPDGLDTGSDSRPPEKKNTATKVGVQTLDLRYLLMQRILVQQVLLDVSSVYRAGNISVPGPFVEISQRELKDRVTLDFPRRLDSTPFHSLRASLMKNMRGKSGSLRGRKKRILKAPDADYRPPLRGILRDFGKDETLADFVKRKFQQFDTDESGKLDKSEIFQGFKSMGVPLTEQEVDELIEDGDTEGWGCLDLEDFGVVVRMISRMEDMGKGLHKRWDASAHHRPMDDQGILYFCDPTRSHFEAKQMIRCFEGAKVQDPILLVSKVPYRAEESFYGDEIDRRMSSRKAWKQSFKDPAFINARRLQRRLRTPDPCLAQFIRLPLHFACANSANPEVGVMVRDLLSAFGGAARAQDAKGRLPLHIACMNESYACVCAVKLLLEEYPEGAQVLDIDGELPLHLCLRHNHGDGALDCVIVLLGVYKEAASIPSGHAAHINSQKIELPVHTALSNYSVDSEKIITNLVNAYPQALLHKDTAGATLLHKFAWIQHPLPVEAMRALEKERGISGSLRSPSVASKESRNAYDPLLMLEAIVRCAKRYEPQLLHTVDNFQATPLHYVCQNGGPCSRAIAQALLKLHTAAAFMQDKKGNTPLHMALGSRNYACAEVIAVRQSAKVLCLPNHKNQLPAEVPGAWKVRFFFKIPSFFEFLNHIFQSVSSPAMVATTAFLAYCYYKLGFLDLCILSLAPLSVLAIAGSMIDVSWAMNTTGAVQGWWAKVQLLLLTLLSWAQLRVPFVGFLSLFSRSRRAERQRASGAGEEIVNASYGLDRHKHLHAFMLLKRIEMPVVALPLSILHAYAILEMGASQDILVYQMCCVGICIFILALSGLDQESFRFWYDAANAHMHRYEICTSFFLRISEALSRWSCYTLFTYAYGLSALILAVSSEILTMLMYGGSLFELPSAPSMTVEAAVREIFDLCGVYHGFGKDSSDGRAALLGKGGMRESVTKFLFQKFILGGLLALSVEKLSSIQALNFREGVRAVELLFASCIVSIIAQLVLFLFRVELYRMRRVQMSSRSRNIKLAAWGIPLFDQTSTDFLREINEEFEYCRFLPGDVILRKGESDNCMHFISSGVAFCYTSKHDRMPRHFDPMHGLEDVQRCIGKGKAACHALRETALGESGLLWKTERTFNVIARTEMETLAITWHTYNAILARFPEDAAVVHDNANRITSRHGDRDAAYSQSKMPICRPEQVRKSCSDMSSKKMPKSEFIEKNYPSVSRGRRPVLDFSAAPKHSAYRILEIEDTGQWANILEEGLRYDIATFLGIEGRNILLQIDQLYSTGFDGVVAYNIVIAPFKGPTVSQRSPETMMTMLEEFVANQHTKSIDHLPERAFLALVQRVVPIYARSELDIAAVKEASQESDGDGEETPREVESLDRGNSEHPESSDKPKTDNSP